MRGAAPSIVVVASLVYDGDCRVCIAAKRIVNALDVRHRIRTVRLRDPETDLLLAEVPVGERGSSFHFIEDGVVASRGEGLVRVLGHVPLGRGIPRFAEDTPVVRRASERVYALLQGLRDALECGRANGTPGR